MTAIDVTPARIYGERGHTTREGEPIPGGTFDERQVRAAAGITMVLGAIAFTYAYFAKVYLPIRSVTAFFMVDFAIRVFWGLRFSPVGVVARLMTARFPPEWVSAAPKRFAWSLGLVMSATMTIITNARITGKLPMSICLICLSLMWLEAVLGLCLGCQIYRAMITRGWLTQGEMPMICSDGACSITDGTQLTDRTHHPALTTEGLTISPRR